MIKFSEAITMLITLFSDFEQDWKQHAASAYAGVGATFEINVFSRFIEDRLKSGNGVELQTLGEVMEKLATEGDEETQTAVCTGFLEWILNCYDSEPSLFMPLIQSLGPECLAYCNAWNKFCGLPKFDFSETIK